MQIRAQTDFKLTITLLPFSFIHSSGPINLYYTADEKTGQVGRTPTFPVCFSVYLILVFATVTYLFEEQEGALEVKECRVGLMTLLG